MQIGFNLWKELLKDKKNEELKKEFFLFFFVSSCLIVIKVNSYIYNFIQFEYPNKVKQFKNWICNHSINLSCCFLAEKALLKYCNWKININSPYDFIDRIYNYLFIKYKNDNYAIEKINKYKDISITILEYAICEYNIFCKYNQIIICLSSLFITMKQNIEEETDECVENSNNFDIQKELKDIVDKIVNKIKFDSNLIESSSSLILQYLEKDDEEENNEKDGNEIKEKENILDINNQLEITRSDSNLSFSEVLNNYIFEYNDNIYSNDTDNNLINFGKISPIYNGENISLDEENEDNLLFLNNKELCKDKEKKDLIINEDLLLLNRKRKEKK